MIYVTDSRWWIEIDFPLLRAAHCHLDSFWIPWNPHSTSKSSSTLTFLILWYWKLAKMSTNCWCCRGNLWIFKSFKKMALYPLYIILLRFASKKFFLYQNCNFQFWFLYQSIRISMHLGIWYYASNTFAKYSFTSFSNGEVSDRMFN